MLSARHYRVSHTIGWLVEPSLNDVTMALQVGHMLDYCRMIGNDPEGERIYSLTIQLVTSRKCALQAFMNE